MFSCVQVVCFPPAAMQEPNTNLLVFLQNKPLLESTRLYQCGVDEQLVMERTGHQSLEGVRNYKRTSDMQRETLSDILNTKKPRVDGTPTTVSNTRLHVTQDSLSRDHALED